jgi:hypothetical protein
MGMFAFWMTLVVVSALCLIGLVLVLIARRTGPGVTVPEARQMFEHCSKQLQSTFFQTAAAGGKPRGLTWKTCEFGREFELARDKDSGEFLALLPVTIAFEAIPGSDMEGVAAVGNLRLATAIFVLRKGEWTTNGRAVFNMSPAETLKHFHHQYEPVSAGGQGGESGAG